MLISRFYRFSYKIHTLKVYGYTKKLKSDHHYPCL